MKRSRLTISVLTVFAGAWQSVGANDSPADEFTARVLPILAQRCHACHSHTAKMANGGLVLDSAGAILKGGESGAAIVPSAGAASALIVRVTSDDPDVQMPPEGERLSAEEVAVLRGWIDRGAAAPASESAGDAADKNAPHWAFAPLVRPALPPVDEASWPRGPIDRFILARLAAEQLAPSPEADRRTLIRRAWFDLAGLPPSPQDVAAFVGDDSPDAWERAVDRLLASPRYGERWARHWLDVARFAETHGHDQDRVREHAWPYRDWVIDALNSDKPAARFIQEQIAADALFPNEPGLAPALGFLAAGPWDESSLRDIREDSIDREIGRYLDRDDIVTAVMSAFASTSAHCARCHDHKFDPITQRDYYALQAVFAGVEKATRKYDVDPIVSRQRGELERQLAALEKREPALLERLLSADSLAAAEQWAQHELTAGREAVWQPLAHAAPSSENGTVLLADPDGSLLATGDMPSTETYSVRGNLPPGTWTGLRLELLPHDSLPYHGPGRADNGNLHLSELEVLVNSADAAGAASRGIPIRTAQADFNQDGWTIAHAIDGRGETAWGIHPRVGEAHEAVFEFAEPITATAASQITIRLKQSHGAKHTIGRFRLSLTTSPGPLALPGWPVTIGRVVGKPAAERSSDEQLELVAHYWRQQWSTELAALPPPRRVYAAASQFEPDLSHKPPTGPRLVQVLRRGDIHKPIEPAAPGALSCIAELPARFDLPAGADESARRVALARWLTDPANPLPWRSLANRLWQHHFGRGLVETPNDFGRMGGRPSHPELLDWLAAELRDSGGSMKALHRLIVTSATYRQTSIVGSAERGARSAERDTNDDNSDLRPPTSDSLSGSELRTPRSALALDPDNRLFWRMNRQRLDAEIVRDAMLAATGQLDLAQGGPSARQFELRPGVHVTPVVDYRQFDWSTPAGHRRGVYRFVFRTLPDPFMETMDFADASQSTAVRSESATPLAALALWNNAFVLHQADALAQRLTSESPELGGQLRRAAELVYSRSPSDEELAEWTVYAEHHGLAALCRVLLNSSEFLYVE